MNEQKKLTITFPLYMQHRMVERAFTALAHQTFKDFCIIVIDDQSPEPFTKIKERFSPSLNITLIKNESNLGAMQNIWKSIQLETNSPYLLSHHADDYLKCDYLEKAIAVLEKNKNVSFVVTGPEWVPANVSYERKLLGETTVKYFDAADFAKNALNFWPFIFGSVVYRVSHLIDDWRYDIMNTYADRYFLGKILETHCSQGAYIEGCGIIEHDHSLDTNDTRSPELNENHAIELLLFYKHLLLEKYNRRQSETIITNSLLYYYGNFATRSSFVEFYKKAKRRDLIQLKRIRGLGLYSLITLPFGQNLKRKISRIVKKLLTSVRLT